MKYDVIIVGGSFAGLSAGLPLARARRRVLIIDAGHRRNRFSDVSHGLLSRDGISPEAIAAEGRAQLLEYPTVDWHEAEVTDISRDSAGFEVVDASGQRHFSRLMIIATGVWDELPDIPGVEERWGQSVFHCPYCHGYELEQGAIGVLATSAAAMHQALMLADWGETTLLLNDAFEPDTEQLSQLKRRGVGVERVTVARLEGDPVEVCLVDGRRLPFAGVFVSPHLHLSPLVAQLGCELEESAHGVHIRTDAHKATSIPGLFACGDGARPSGSVPLAVGDGALAGLSAHQALMFS